MNLVNCNDELNVSEVALGCWRMDVLSDEAALNVVQNALNNGINFFDHADIYGNGVSEEKFGRVWKNAACSREEIIIQSKAGIFLEENYYDFTKTHILEAVDGSLKRLQTDYLDVLLLHRPDTLFEPEEVAEAFDVLERSGKVRYFGVSNQNPTQIELLKKCVKQKLYFNQLQFSLMHTGLVDAGICVNNNVEGAVVRDGGALEYCRKEEIKLQAWSPFQYGFFEGIYLDNPKFPELNCVIQRMAEEKGVPGSAIAAAWILRHPAFAQCIVGTMNTERLTGICQASEVELTVREWYELYKAAGHFVP